MQSWSLHQFRESTVMGGSWSPLGIRQPEEVWSLPPQETVPEAMHPPRRKPQAGRSCLSGAIGQEPLLRQKGACLRLLSTWPVASVTPGTKVLILFKLI